MIKSELVQRIAVQNPHLYQRDVENIVNAILNGIIAAHCRPASDANGAVERRHQGRYR
jgi:nucleoid DNA-binding protein